MDRAIWASLGGLALLMVSLLLWEKGPSGMPWLFPECPFHRFTGLHCPGCGMTRAVHATLHGRLGDAFRSNLVGMILLPPAMVALGIQMAGWIREKPLPVRVRVSSRMAWAIVWAVVVFSIVRNIPSWPFNLLAPP